MPVTVQWIGLVAAVIAAGMGLRHLYIKITEPPQVVTVVELQVLVRQNRFVVFGAPMYRGSEESLDEMLRSLTPLSSSSRRYPARKPIRSARWIRGSKGTRARS